MIIVVSGLPRSGTSMMMQILHTGGLDVMTDDVRAPDDSNPRGYFEYEPVKALARTADWVAAAEGKVVKVIAQLVPRLPSGHEYAILFMNRDLDEILSSQTAMLARLGRQGGALDPQSLKTVFERQLASAVAFAESRSDMRSLTVDYARVLQDPAASIESIKAFLGVNLDVAQAAAAVDPALYRERLGDSRNR